MMHVAAIDLEAAKGERFAAAAGSPYIVDLGKMLKEWDPQSKAPTRVVPAALIRFFALFMADMKAVRGNLGRTSEVSGAKAQKTFGFTFIPVSDSLIASAEAVKGS